MSYKRVLTVQDISCVGQCSLTVALPILSACGMETAILPTAILSTHTGGFSGYTVRDLSEDIPAIKNHWQKENIKFDAIYTGYLGKTEETDYVKEILETLGSDNCLKVVDPAMADNGKLYYGFDAEYVEGMKNLCSVADILLPNITEASFLTGIDYKETYTQEYVLELCEKLCNMGAKAVVLTGVSYKAETTGIVVYKDGKYDYYEHKKLAKGKHGTGDIYASAFVGAVLNGKDYLTAAKIAADYTVKCMENTEGDEDHWYGVKFETALADLMQTLN